MSPLSCPGRKLVPPAGRLSCAGVRFANVLWPSSQRGAGAAGKGMWSRSSSSSLSRRSQSQSSWKMRAEGGRGPEGAIGERALASHSWRPPGRTGRGGGRRPAAASFREKPPVRMSTLSVRSQTRLRRLRARLPRASSSTTSYRAPRRARRRAPPADRAVARGDEQCIAEAGPRASPTDRGCIFSSRRRCKSRSAEGTRARLH